MDVVVWFGEVLGAIRDVWLFRTPDVLLRGPSSALSTGLGVAMLAGLATMVGHAVVFWINRVTRLRMAAGMAIGAVFTALLRVLTAGLTALLAWVATAGEIDAQEVGVCYLFSLAPLALSFLVFVPYVGLYLGRLLEGWALLCLVALLTQALGMQGWAALALAGGTWVVSQVLSRVLAGPLASMTSKVWTVATGRETFLTAHDILSGAPFVPLERGEQHA